MGEEDGGGGTMPQAGAGGEETRAEPEAGDGVLKAVRTGGPFGPVDDAADGEGVLGQRTPQGSRCLRPPVYAQELLHKGSFLSADCGVGGHVGEGEVDLPQGSPEVFWRCLRQDVQGVLPECSTDDAQPEPEAAENCWKLRLSQG